MRASLVGNNMNTIKIGQSVWVAGIAILLGGCDDSSQQADTHTPASISAPTALNLFAAAGTQQESQRFFVMVTTVGEATVHLPLAFDTGSSGITLNAPSFLPESMVTQNGLVFPPGQTSISYLGITITNQQGTRAVMEESTSVSMYRMFLSG